MLTFLVQCKFGGTKDELIQYVDPTPFSSLKSLNASMLKGYVFTKPL